MKTVTRPSARASAVIGSPGKWDLSSSPSRRAFCRASSSDKPMKSVSCSSGNDTPQPSFTLAALRYAHDRPTIPQRRRGSSGPSGETGKDVRVSAQRQRAFRLATTAAGLLSLVLWAVALTHPLLPRTGWEWSWEQPPRATASGVAGSTAAAAGVGLAIRAWRRPLRRPQRGLVFAILLLAATAASALTFVRSGAWLSDMRIEIVDGTGAPSVPHGFCSGVARRLRSLVAECPAPAAGEDKQANQHQWNGQEPWPAEAKVIGDPGTGPGREGAPLSGWVRSVAL